jgi:CheY-like chemotaxis protein
MEKKRVLIIDDDRAFTRVVKLTLEQERIYDVIEQNDPDSAVLAALNHQPAFIFLAVFFRGRDGGMIASHLKEHPLTQHIPIVFVATRSMKYKGNAGPMWMAGFPFITKPTNRLALLRCVKQVLNPSDGADGSPEPANSRLKNPNNGRDRPNPATRDQATDQTA